MAGVLQRASSSGLRVPSAIIFVMPRYLFLFLLLVAGCARGPQQNGSLSLAKKATAPAENAAEQITRAASQRRSLPRDDLGRDIKLAGVPQRIVTIGPGATETVFALGAGSRLIGRDSASDYPAAALKVPIAGDYTGPALEAVIAARPDLVIVQGETYGRARIEDWQRKIGVPVASLAATTVEEVAQDIEKIGAWLDVRDAARKLAQRLPRPQDGSAAERQLAAMKTKSGAKPHSAFFEVGRSPLWTAGRGTLINDVMTHAGLLNTARDINGYKQYGLESLMVREPDYYIVTAKQSEHGRVLRELRHQPSLGRLRCIREGRVLIVSTDLVLRPGPRLAQGISELLRQQLSLRRRY